MDLVIALALGDGCGDTKTGLSKPEDSGVETRTGVDEPDDSGV